MSIRIRTEVNLKKEGVTELRDGRCRVAVRVDYTEGRSNQRAVGTRTGSQLFLYRDKRCTHCHETHSVEQTAQGHEVTHMSRLRL